MKSSRSIGFLFSGLILALLLGASVLTAGCTKVAPVQPPHTHRLLRSLLSQSLSAEGWSRYMSSSTSITC